jgi:hypothetical protein
MITFMIRPKNLEEAEKSRIKLASVTLSIYSYDGENALEIGKKARDMLLNGDVEMELQNVGMLAPIELDYEEGVGL